MNECKWDRKRGRGVCGPTSIIATKAILLSVAVGGSSDRDGDASVHPSIHEKRLLLHLLLLHAVDSHASIESEREREKKGLERREISRMDQASGNNDKKQAAAAFVFVSFSVSQLAIASLSA